MSTTQLTPLPEHWLSNVKKIYVTENVDYYTREGSTTITIQYKSWWKFRRKLKFARIPRKGGEDQNGTRSPEAEAVILKLKQSMSSTKEASVLKKAAYQKLSLVWSPFRDQPVMYNNYAKLPSAKKSTEVLPGNFKFVEVKDPKDGAGDQASSVSMLFVTVRR